METYRLAQPAEAVRLTQGNVRAAAEWISPPPDARGYFQYGDGPARIDTPAGELRVPLGHWIVRLGGIHIVLDPATFEATFARSDG